MNPIGWWEQVLRPGRCHLVEYGVPMAFQLFREAIKNNSEGLCISTELPENVKAEHDVDCKELIWLSRTGTEKSIVPGDLEGLRDKISEFTDVNERGVILLDGLEYLTTTNGFDRTLEFLHDIWEKIALANVKLIMPISPSAFGRKELALLERYSEVLEAVE